MLWKYFSRRENTVCDALVPTLEQRVAQILGAVADVKLRIPNGLVVHFFPVQSLSSFERVTLIVRRRQARHDCEHESAGQSV